jgi:hypothetical protein
VKSSIPTSARMMVGFLGNMKYPQRKIFRVYKAVLSKYGSIPGRIMALISFSTVSTLKG